MDNTMVSARVSRAKKERAGSVLASIGATTSDLINSALEYVIKEKRLPTDAPAERPDQRAFAAFVESSTLDIDWPADGRPVDYKELMRQGRLADYESLA